MKTSMINENYTSESSLKAKKITVILCHLSFPPLLTGKPMNQSHYFEYLGATENATNHTASIPAKTDNPKIDKSANFTYSIFECEGVNISI